MTAEDNPDVVESVAEAALPEGEPVVAPNQELRLILERLNRLEQAVVELASQVSLLAERVDPLPRQIRQVGSKVDDITELIGQPRLRDLLSSLLLLYDLTCQIDRAAEPAAASGYQVLCDQIVQMLAVNGITPDSSSGTVRPHAAQGRRSRILRVAGGRRPDRQRLPRRLSDRASSAALRRGHRQALRLAESR